jgi:hypothetical protein
MEREGPLDPDPVRDLPNGEAGPDVPPSPADHDPFKGLNPLLLAFHDPDEHLDGIPRIKVGDIPPHLFFFQHFHDIHKPELLFNPYGIFFSNHFH